MLKPLTLFRFPTICTSSRLDTKHEQKGLQERLGHHLAPEQKTQPDQQLGLARPKRRHLPEEHRRKVHHARQPHPAHHDQLQPRQPRPLPADQGPTGKAQVQGVDRRGGHQRQ